MREAHGAGAFAPRDLAYRLARRVLDALLEIEEAIPGNRSFDGIAHHAARDRVLAQVRAAHELVAPVVRRTAALRILLPEGMLVPSGAVIGA